MKLSTYEKAMEIRSRLSHLQDIRNTLVNSKGRTLQAVDTFPPIMPTMIEDKCMRNEVVIDSDKDRQIIQDMVKVIDNEMRKLNEEFEGL